MQFRNSKSKTAGESEQTSTIAWAQLQTASNHFSSKSSGDRQNRLSSTREQVQSLIQQGKVSSLEDSFLWQFQKLNRKAVKLIDQGLFEQAEVPLNTAEQILQQAGSQGKIINFAHIITLFHNQICHYQQTWQLQICVSYVEAVIYNIKCQIQKNQKQKFTSIFAQQSSELRGILAHYYLIFCAFNSQLKQHDTALIAAKRSNLLLKEYFQQICLKLNANAKFTELKQNYQELKWLSTHIGNLQKPTLLQITDDLLSLKRNNVLHNKHTFYELSEQFKNYTIAQLMELQPILNFSINTDSFLKKSNLLMKIFMFSMSYFTMATQLRLLAKKALMQGLQLRQINQYKQSQCYHLKAIIILLYFVPFDLIYLQHLLQSFKLHYSIELYKSPSIYQSSKSYQMVTEKIKRFFSEVEVRQIKNCSKSKLTNQISALNSKLSNNKKEKSQTKNDIVRFTHQNIQKGKSMSTHTMFSVFNKLPKSNRLKLKKRQLKHACMTSVQSPNKLSFTNTPRRLSPKGGRYQVEQSQKQQIEVEKHRKNKKSQIISQYFDSEIIYMGGIKQQKSKVNKENKLRHIDLNKIKTLNNQDYQSKSKKTTKRQTQNKRKDENLKTVKSTSSLTKRFK